MVVLQEFEQSALKDLEQEEVRGRKHSATLFKRQEGTWVYVIGERDGVTAKALLLPPRDGQGWTVMVDEQAEDRTLCWDEMAIVGSERNLSYSEACQAAMGFVTEAVYEFDFHRGIALSGWPTEEGRSRTTLLETHDNRRAVTFFAKDGVCYARGCFLTWNAESQSFDESKSVIRFPEANYYVGMDYLIEEAYDWLVQGLFDAAEDFLALAMATATELRRANSGR